MVLYEIKFDSKYKKNNENKKKPALVKQALKTNFLIDDKKS